MARVGGGMEANVSSFQPGSGQGEGICVVELHRATPSGGDAKAVTCGPTELSPSHQADIKLTRNLGRAHHTWFFKFLKAVDPLQV